MDIKHEFTSKCSLNMAELILFFYGTGTDLLVVLNHGSTGGS